MKKAKIVIKKRVWSGWVRWWTMPICIVLRMIDSWGKKIVYLSQSDVFVLECEAHGRYELKVGKVSDNFVEVESLSKGLTISHDGGISLKESDQFKNGVLVLGRSLSLSTQKMDQGATWKLSLKEIIEE